MHSLPVEPTIDSGSKNAPRGNNFFDGETAKFVKRRYFGPLVRVAFSALSPLNSTSISFESFCVVLGVSRKGQSEGITNIYPIYIISKK